jgi:hypothetical protein
MLLGLGARGCPIPGLREPTTPTPTGTAPEVGGRLDNVEKATRELLDIQPKLAITMREYGARFVAEYYAAKGGNWALAGYEDHYMRAAMKPASVTKPAEFKTLRGWETTNLDPLLSLMGKQDFAAYDAQYRKIIKACNDCHDALGYQMVKFVLPPVPEEPRLDYTRKTKATDYKDFKVPSTTAASPATTGR